jgi:hypothetical protein
MKKVFVVKVHTESGDDHLFAFNDRPSEEWLNQIFKDVLYEDWEAETINYSIEEVDVL